MQCSGACHSILLVLPLTRLCPLQTSYAAEEDASLSADAKKPSRKDQDSDLQFPDEVACDATIH